MTDCKTWLTVLYLVLLFQFLTDPGVVLAQNHCKLLEGPRSSSGQDLQQSDHFVLSGRLLLQNKRQKRTDYFWMKGKKFIVHMMVAWTVDWTKIVPGSFLTLWKVLCLLSHEKYDCSNTARDWNHSQGEYCQQNMPLGNIQVFLLFFIYFICQFFKCLVS